MDAKIISILALIYVLGFIAGFEAMQSYYLKKLGLSERDMYDKKRPQLIFATFFWPIVFVGLIAHKVRRLFTLPLLFVTTLGSSQLYYQPEVQMSRSTDSTLCAFARTHFRVPVNEARKIQYQYSNEFISIDEVGNFTCPSLGIELCNVNYSLTAVDYRCAAVFQRLHYGYIVEADSSIVPEYVVILYYRKQECFIKVYHDGNLVLYTGNNLLAYIFPKDD